MAATGILNLQLQALEDALVLSDTWKAAHLRGGVASATAAREAIHWDRLEADANNDRALASCRPYMLIKHAQLGAQEVGTGIAVDLQAGFGLLIYLEAAATGQTHKASFQEFNNVLGGIIDDLVTLDGGDDAGLRFQDFEMVVGPTRTIKRERDDVEDYWYAVVQLNSSGGV